MITGRKIPGSVFCGAIPLDNWMISPNGYVAKCTVAVDDKDRSLGKLFPDGRMELNSDAQKWLDFSPFNVDKCVRCNVLPLCMGGCLMTQFDAPFVSRCYLKDKVLDFVKDVMKNGEN
jgi:radical SAM protein with 4Fe4S-binding SPASM domain